MSYSFNASANLIVVQVELFGPTGSILIKLALDTGATRTQINTDVLRAVGYDPANVTKHSRIITGSGIITAPHIPVQKLAALGQTRHNLLATGFNLPKGSRVDGLLGLDFFRGLSLNIDFRSGLITLT